MNTMNDFFLFDEKLNCIYRKTRERKKTTYTVKVEYAVILSNDDERCFNVVCQKINRNESIYSVKIASRWKYLNFQN